MRQLLPVLLLLLASATAARAADPPDCDGIMGEDPQVLRGGVVVGKGRADVVTALSPECLAQPARCKSNYAEVFMRPGDHLAVTGESQGYLCVERRGGPGLPFMGGWLAARRIQIPPVQTDAQARRWWSGRWEAPASWLVIWERGGRFHARGTARWDGNFGQSHFGDFDGEGELRNGGLELTGAEGCELRLVRVAKGFVAMDNHKCASSGNVRFAEFYDRRP